MADRGKTLPVVLITIGVLAFGLWIWQSRVGPSSSLKSSPGVAREYGALESQSNVDSLFDQRKNGESTSKPVAPAGDEQDRSTFAVSTRSREKKHEQNEARLREADSNRVFGRPASVLDVERLRKQGFGEEEIDQIRENFQRYAEAIREESEDGTFVPSYRLDEAERAERRAIRESLMSDRAFDAALFATNQRNRVVLTRIADGKRTGAAGLREGDQIIKVNGIRVFDRPDFQDGLHLVSEGDFHRVEILRANKRLEFTIECCQAGWSEVRTNLAAPLPYLDER